MKIKIFLLLFLTNFMGHQVLSNAGEMPNNEYMKIKKFVITACENNNLDAMLYIVLNKSNFISKKTALCLKRSAFTILKNSIQELKKCSYHNFQKDEQPSKQEIIERLSFKSKKAINVIVTINERLFGKDKTDTTCELINRLL